MKDTLYSDILDTFRSMADPDRIESSRRNHPTRMEVIGVVVPNIRKVLKEVAMQIRTWPVPDRLALVHRLCDSGCLECQMLGFMLLEKDSQAVDALDEAGIDALGRVMDNWVSVDCYSLMVVGQAWRRGNMGIERIYRYLQSADFWQRRIAVVATVALNLKSKGGRGDVEHTLAICSRVVNDHHDLINKALSWTLRELAKREPEPVYRFLEQHHDKLHGRVLREVGHKLKFGTKN